MGIQTPRDLFEHELMDLYDAEIRLTELLPQLAGEAQNPQVKAGFQQHAQETQQQVKNIEQCFQELGIQPERQTCLGIQGFKQEHDAFIKEQPSPEVLNLFLLGAAEKTEHYEMVAYEGLINMASLMGQNRVVDLLSQNLQQEERMASKAHELEQQLSQQALAGAGV